MSLGELVSLWCPRPKMKHCPRVMPQVSLWCPNMSQGYVPIYAPFPHTFAHTCGLSAETHEISATPITVKISLVDLGVALLCNSPNVQAWTSCSYWPKGRHILRLGELANINTFNNVETSYFTPPKKCYLSQRFDVRRTSWSRLDCLQLDGARDLEITWSHV